MSDLHPDCEEIWLEPRCADPYEGRLWSDACPFDDCECDGEKHPPVKYVRADLHEALLADRERLAKEVAELRHRYPHMCRDEHVEIGHAEDENCPLCHALGERDFAHAALRTSRGALLRTRTWFAIDLEQAGFEFVGAAVAEIDAALAVKETT